MDVPRQPRRSFRRPIVIALVLAALAPTTWAARRWRRAPPSVDGRLLYIDTVRRGELVRTVEGPGTLQPVEIRWRTAVSAGRVAAIHARPGAEVRASTVLVELENPDVQLAALEADRQLASAQAELTHLQATHDNTRLQQESSVVALEAELAEAQRRAGADERLAAHGFVAALDRGRSESAVRERASRLALEQRRLAVLDEGVAAQLSAQRAQIARLSAIAQFRRAQVADLAITAGVDGVLQDLPLEVGQWVAPGSVLAKVARPDRLKAVLKIPEAQAGEVALGQRATVDVRSGTVAGRVARVEPAVQGGVVKVEIALDGVLPAGARPDLSVEGIIELERLPNVLHVGRPALAQSGAQLGLFRVDGSDGVRVPVKLGRASSRAVEIAGGLVEGDRVVLSETSQWESFDRIHLQ
jgi:multidrug efflux pump subunit AcrA (membrane-fusion protein)